VTQEPEEIQLQMETKRTANKAEKQSKKTTRNAGSKKIRDPLVFHVFNDYTPCTGSMQSVPLLSSVPLDREAGKRAAELWPAC